MPLFIELNQLLDDEQTKAVYVNHSYITHMYPIQRGTRVICGINAINMEIYVTETIEQIIDKCGY